jgi:lipoprotein-anchoring transpeptidase ErfK/SrfK
MCFSISRFRSAGALLATAGAVLAMQPASAQTLAYSDSSSRYPASIFEQIVPQASVQQQGPYESIVPEPAEAAAALPENLRRQVVNYPTREAPGTVVVDTPNTYLYYVLGGGKAIRYGIGVGREGFTWSGVRSIERKAEWPDWIPPAEMIVRQPYLPRWMAGGEGNPLGARAMYIGGTVYRIHGTNAPSTIGHNVSSGCIRLLNEDVIDLYSRVNIGTKVVVLPAGPRSAPVVASYEQRMPQATVVSNRTSRVY